MALLALSTISVFSARDMVTGNEPSPFKAFSHFCCINTASIFTFHNPEENGYLVHTDAETGPGGTFDEYFADGNLTVEYEGWDYTPMEF